MHRNKIYIYFLLVHIYGDFLFFFCFAFNFDWFSSGNSEVANGVFPHHFSLYIYCLVIF